MGILDEARKRQSKSGSVLSSARARLGVSETDTQNNLQSILNKIEEDRKKSLYEQQGVGELSQKIQEQEAPAKGFTPLGLFSGIQQTYRDLTRGKKDEEYLKQIDSNSKTIKELLKRKKENPENSGDYDVMLQALSDKNKMLEEASGGALADTKNDLFVGTPFETSKKLVGQSLSTATDVMPFGAGITQVGKQVLKQGGKKVLGSLAKEGATFGFVGGTGELLQKEEKVTPMQALGELATSAMIGTVSNAIIGSTFNKIGEKLTDWFSGKKVEFTPKEKDFMEENVPEMSNEELFNQAGIESPIKKTDTDLMAKSIAETNNEEVIKKLLSGKVDKKDIPTLTKTLKSVTDEDAVSGILDEYNPTKIKERLAIEIATTDNEKKIASLIKGQVSETDIPAVSRILKRVEDETEVQKILDEFKIKETPTETPKEVTPTEVTEPVKQTTPATPTSPVEKSSVKSDIQVPKEDPLITEARKYKSKEIKELVQHRKEVGAKDFANDLKIMLEQKERREGNLPTYAFNNALDMLEKSDDFVLGSKIEDVKPTVGNKNFEYAVERKMDDIKKGKKLYIYLDKNNNILDGNHAYLAYKKLGYKEIPTIKGATKSQLSSIYKQAHETPKKEPINEAPKTEPKKEAPKEHPKSKTKKSSLVRTLNKNAEERGVTLKKEDVPRLASRMKMDEESKKAFRVYAQDPSKAIEMAVNGTAPEGIRTGSLYTVVRDTAIIENDVDTLYRLRNSKEAREVAAEAGREVKSYDSSLRSDPVKVMREIDDLKQKIAESEGIDTKAEVKTTLKELKDIVEKEDSGNTGFEKLINSIKC